MAIPDAYEGEETYVFISYAHKNGDQILGIISKLKGKGYRVWYDAGIEAGTEWPEYIAQRLASCGCFVAFITKDFLESQNCRREINYAISKDLPMLAVYMEEVTLSPGMEMQLGTIQALFRHRHPDEQSFLDALCQATVLKPCRPSFFNNPRKPQIKLDYKLDPMFTLAVEFAVEFGSVSVNLLQRRFGITLSHAGKIIDQMVDVGVVGPYDGAASRKILINKEDWLEIRLRLS